MEEEEPPTWAYALQLLLIIATGAAWFTVMVVWPSPGYPWPRHFEWLDFFSSRPMAGWTIIFTGIGLNWLLLPRLRK
ncbi:MAG TPA: hypothetical protein VLL04_00410 [Rhizomicrobium sp.]|nr:hypothetical protein [Rhizomicrobium sp.]